LEGTSLLSKFLLILTRLQCALRVMPHSLRTKLPRWKCYCPSASVKLMRCFHAVKKQCTVQERIGYCRGAKGPGFLHAYRSRQSNQSRKLLEVKQRHTHTFAVLRYCTVAFWTYRLLQTVQYKQTTGARSFYNSIISSQYMLRTKRVYMLFSRCLKKIYLFINHYCLLQQCCS
jgi:hypothetical protein